jgi:anti-sigma regulatory factor (Ser/Thr protein kinase)
MAKLIPKPHMLKSIRSRNWHLGGAIEELVDNSLGHGQATKVDVVIDNGNGIAVIDDGIGIDDINRVFRLGDASSHDKLSEIGQYGVGAKNATIYLGDHVRVRTTRDGRRHLMTVDWGQVERNGEWPDAYQGNGVPTAEKGTKVIIGKLARHYQLATSEKLARELGQVFAPALRAGTNIRVYHRLKDGHKQVLDVEPFNPPDLTQEITITGEIDTPRGPLKWTGRAGLSASLTERFNGVHIAFGHRVIETTREPFHGESAPTLYAEIALDDTTPWKHQLSEHKDKVVGKYRGELILSIYRQIEALLKQSANQASYLALKEMTVPIEAQLTRALKGAGVLHVDPEEEPEEGGTFGDTDTPVTPSKQTRTPVEDGDDAQPQKPTGVQIDWRDKDQLEGKLWSWEITGKQMLLLLDKDQFRVTIGYPPKVRDQVVVQLIAALLSHAIEAEYRLGSPALKLALTSKLRKQIEEWALEDPHKIAPYLNRAILIAAN